jgi:hypothetical protein
MLEPLSERVNDLGWHVQIHTQGHQISEAADLLQRLPSRSYSTTGCAFRSRPASIIRVRIGAEAPRQRPDEGEAIRSYFDTRTGPPTYADVGKVARAYGRRRRNEGSGAA